jgi:hypothetical protein
VLYNNVRPCSVKSHSVLCTDDRNFICISKFIFALQILVARLGKTRNFGMKRRDHLAHLDVDGSSTGFSFSSDLSIN